MAPESPRNEPLTADDPRVTTLVQHYRDLLRKVYGGQRWILASEAMAQLTGPVGELRDLGAHEAMCIAASRGAGRLPDPSFAPVQLEIGGLQAPTMMASVRLALAQLEQVPGHIQRAVDDFDPFKSCPVIGPFFGPGTPIAERRVWASRPQAWRDLEDKTRIDAFWESLGIPHEPSTVVRANDLEALLHESGQLDRYGDGVVWVGDNREGFHGGGEYLRRIANREEGSAALDFFVQHCDHVRVMPFLEGIPCSVHGIVFADDQIALRPCEMVVLRKAGSTGFHYAGTATFWDPPEADRQEMRGLALRVGAELRERVGYRGVFTLDGVMTRRGFRPTELNPRYGGAIGQLVRRVPELPLLLLHYAIIERDELDYRPRDLEGLLLDLGDRFRAGIAMAMVDKAVTEQLEYGLSMSSGTPTILEDADDPRSEWTVSLGPAMTGGFLAAVPDFDKVPKGPAFAPQAALVLNYLDAAWGLGLGQLQAATDVRQ